MEKKIHDQINITLKISTTTNNRFSLSCSQFHFFFLFKTYL